MNDGLSSDINIACTKDTLKANWSNSSDPNSGITKYWYSIGTSAGSTNIKNWTNVGLSNQVITYVGGLVNGQTYYFNVRAENGAGLLANIASSNGQTVDTTCVSSYAFIYQTNKQIKVYPNPVDDKLYIDGIENNDVVEIYDVMGRKILNVSEKVIPTSKLANGLYWIRILNNNQKSIYENKIIVHH
ncbi:MAG: T9SS type A sorting domain-containing protein [Bacteroidia bacterium]|nr:T9SS type A sorting domain-containing protein [Bacteroidia bacterium]